MLSVHLRGPVVIGRKEVAALVASVLITVLIVVFQEQLQNLEQFGYVGAFLAMLISNATLVLPAGGLVIIFFLGNALANVWLLALVAALGSAIGELTGYLAGYSSRSLITRTKTYGIIEARVRRNSTWTIMLLAAIPSPVFDVAGIAAGALKVPWWKFLGAAFVGKFFKMLIVAMAGKYSVGWIEQLLR